MSNASRSSVDRLWRSGLALGDVYLSWIDVQSDARPFLGAFEAFALLFMPFRVEAFGFTA